MTTTPQPQLHGAAVIRSNEVLEAQAAANEAAMVAPVQISALAAHISTCLAEARQSKVDIERDLLLDLQQRKGEYDEDTKAIIEREGGTTVYDNVTEYKCAGAESWLTDLMINGYDEKPWGYDPTVKPDLPPEVVAQIAESVMQDVMQVMDQYGIPPEPVLVYEAAMAKREQAEKYLQAESRKRAEAMEQTVYDELSEVKFNEVISELINDFCTYRACILKGPVLESDDVLEWGKDQQGRSVPIQKSKLRWHFRRVSPFDFFHQPGINDLDQGYTIERIWLSDRQLSRLKDIKGYDPEAIERVMDSGLGLDANASGPVDQDRYRLENSDSVRNQRTLREGWIYTDSVRGSILNDMQPQGSTEPMADEDGNAIERERGTRGPYEDDRFYNISAVMIGTEVIRVVQNPDITGHKPYYMASFRALTGSLWGRSVPMLMRDRQKVINSTFRAATNNIVMCSLPQTEIDVDKLAEGEQIESLVPGRIWQKSIGSSGQPGNLLNFYTPPFIGHDMMRIREALERQADNDTGIPPYSYGSDEGAGAAKTLGGLQILMASSSKGIRKAILNFDTGILKPALTAMWMMEMLYNPDEAIKGDVEVVSRGALSMLRRAEESNRKSALLGATNNQTDMMIMGIPGRAKLLRDVIKSQDLDPEGIVPSEEQIKERLATPPPAAPVQPAAPSEPQQ
jgi:hypothetical protein